MTNFDRKNLESFISAHRGLTPEEVKRLLEEKEKPTVEEKKEPVVERKEEPVVPKIPKSYFESGDVVTFSWPTGPEEYRIVDTQNGMVTVRSTENPVKGYEVFPEEDLKKIEVEKEKKPSYPPLKEFFQSFNEKDEKEHYKVEELLKWRTKWVDSGEIDRYRKNYQDKNLSVSDEQVANAKKALDFYIKLFQEDSLPNELRAPILSGIGLSVRILTGIHHPVANNIEYYIKNNIPVLTKDYADRFREAIEKAKRPTATPDKVPTLADVRNTWPSYIIFEPKRGWSYLNKTLPIREWTKAGENIRPVFDEYREFMLKGSSKEQERKWELYRSLIDTKNRVVDALHKALDSTAELETAMREAAELRRLIEEKKEEWRGEQFDAEIKTNIETSRKESWDRFDWLRDRLIEEKKKVKALSVWQLSPERAAFIERLVSDASKAEAAVKKTLANIDSDTPINPINRNDALNRYERSVNELSAQVKATDERYAGLSADKRTGLVLRPSYLTKVRRKDTRTVTLRGGEKISVNEWLDREKERKENKTKEETSARENTKRELLALHEEMYADDPDEYKRLYQYKKYLPGDITKEVADMVLRNEGGVRLPEEKPAEGGGENRKAPINSLVDYRMTYSPSAEQTQKKDGKNVQDPRTEEQRLEDQVTPRLAGFDTLKDVLKTPYGAGMTTYGEGVTSAEQFPWRPQSEERARESESQAPSRQEQERKLGKISATLAARMEKFMVTRWIKKHPLWFLLSTAAFSLVVASVANAPAKDEGPIAAAPTISAPGRMDSANWKAYLTPTNKKGIEIIEDITKFDNQKLLEKHFSSYVKKGDTIAAKNFLERKDADKIISPNYEHIPGCDDKQRDEAGCIILAAQDMASALLAAANEKVKQGHAPYAFQSKLNNVITQGVTPEAYFKALREARRDIESKA